MIIQENDFLKTYNGMSKLWEDVGTKVNGVTVSLKRNFQHPDQLISNMPKRTPGIYLIKYNHPENGAQYYVGKSVDIKYRTHIHFNICPENDSRLLHQKIKRHYKRTVPERFSIAILEEGVAIEELNKLEAYWIEALDTYHLTNKTIGLNLTRGGDGGGRATVTPAIYDAIVDRLENTTLSIQDIAADPSIDKDKKIVYLVNNGLHWLSTGDRNYPIRDRETTAAIGQETHDTKVIANSAIAHIVYRGSNKNYYYFPTTTQAAEFAVMAGRFQSEGVARAKIKKNALRVTTLDEFKECTRTWGILKTVPDVAASNGGFTGEEVKNERGQVLGIKLA
jgi:hypothetical protein